jgi:crooked neck
LIDLIYNKNSNIYIFIDIEDVIVSKRKYQYEQEVQENPSNYDAWFDYLRLVESEGNINIIRETYERAIANVPPTKVK